jgi:hypothetical protein
MAETDNFHRHTTIIQTENVARENKIIFTK